MLLPLAEAMEQSDEYSDETYIRKVNSMTVQSIRTMSVSEWVDWAKTKYQVTKQFLNSSLSKKEKVIAILLGYTLNDWLALKKQDPQATTDLINATSELIEAVGIPTSYTSAALTLFGPFAKFAGKVNTIATKVLAKKLPLNQSGYVKKLISGIELAKAKLYKIIGKTPPKIVSNNPCFKKYSLSDDSFNIQSFKILVSKKIICDTLEDLTKHLSGLNVNKGLKKLYPGKIPVSNIIRKNSTTFKDLLKIGKQNLSPWQRDLYNETLNIIETTIRNEGVSVKKIKNYEIYTPDFESVSIYSLKMSDYGKNLLGNHSWSLTNGDFSTATQALFNKMKLEKKIPSDLKYSDFRIFLTKFLTWEHNPDLNTMLLVPRTIHKYIGHWGSAVVLSSSSEIAKAMWKGLLIYE